MAARTIAGPRTQVEEREHVPEAEVEKVKHSDAAGMSLFSVAKQRNLLLFLNLHPAGTGA